ncbi:MAG: phospholipase D family protein [Rhodoferax sp.]
MALAGYALRESPDPVEVLEAIRSSAGKLDIFCQAGGIRADRWPSDLVSLLEKSIHQVPRPKPGCLFHPKMWILRYSNAANNGELRYRCLILSRNLTQDRSWDLILRLDSDFDSGSMGINPGNQNLNRFVASLPLLAGFDQSHARLNAINEIADELRKVWWEMPEDVQDIQFWPFGLPGMRKPKTEELFTGYRHLIVSPFISPAGLRIALGDSKGTSLSVVSRAEELDRIAVDEIPEGTYFHINPLASLGGDDEHQEMSVETEQMLGDLHGKLYVVETNRRARVFIGSANATERAFNGNVEILCEISGGATRLGVESMLGEDSSFREILERYSFPESPLTDAQKELSHGVESYLFDLAGLKLQALASREEQEWSVLVTSDVALPKPNGFEAELYICQLNKQADKRQMSFEQVVRVNFESIKAADITPFMVLVCVGRRDSQVVEKQTVVCATLIGEPEQRLDEILVRQIDTPEKFLRLIDLLLGLGGSFPLASLADNQSAGGAWVSTGLSSGLLEMIVRSLAERPDALDHLESLVNRLSSTELGRSVLPPGWNELWGSVVGARKLMGREG